MKYAWIESHRDQYDVVRMCRQLGVSRTGYCQWRKRAASERAMANATLEAMAVADWVAPSVTEDGVAVLIDRFILRDTCPGG